MTRKKKGQKRGRPSKRFICYYCLQEFQLEDGLVSHQLARHFRCPHCPRKFRTMGSLCEHSLDTHKSVVERVPNAIAGHDSPSVSVYGMQNAPMEFLIEHGLVDTTEEDSKRAKTESGMVAQPQMVGAHAAAMGAQSAMMSGGGPRPMPGFFPMMPFGGGMPRPFFGMSGPPQQFPRPPPPFPNPMMAMMMQHMRPPVPSTSQSSTSAPTPSVSQALPTPSIPPPAAAAAAAPEKVNPPPQTHEPPAAETGLQLIFAERAFSPEELRARAYRAKRA